MNSREEFFEQQKLIVNERINEVIEVAEIIADKRYANEKYDWGDFYRLTDDLKALVSNTITLANTRGSILVGTGFLNDCCNKKEE